jgi:TetR/AcrR family transcriptional regulator, ethionamide resistance regulator
VRTRLPGDEHADARRGPRRGRRPKTYAAVLEATARLLQTVPLAELSVAQILDAAGVGRTSFYEHFSSKDDVVIKLMRSISAEVAEELEPLFERGPLTPEQAVRQSFQNLLRISSGYASLLVAVSEEWPAVPELRELWFAVMGAVSERLAEAIARDRRDGLAPPGADPQALAAALVWTAERSFHVATAGGHPTLVSAGELVEPLVQLFVGSIYGRPAAVSGSAGVAVP